MKKQNYSPSERALLNLIPINGRVIDRNELVKKRWPRSDRPFNAGAIVNATLRILMRKVEHNDEDFRIVKGPRRGPFPTRYRVKAINRRRRRRGNGRTP